MITVPFIPFPAPDDDRERTAEARSRARFHELLGPVRPYLDDPDVTKVDVSSNDSIFVERFGAVAEPVPDMMPARSPSRVHPLFRDLGGRAIDALHARLACDMP